MLSHLGPSGLLSLRKPRARLQLDISEADSSHKVSALQLLECVVDIALHDATIAPQDRLVKLRYVSGNPARGSWKVAKTQAN